MVLRGDVRGGFMFVVVKWGGGHYVGEEPRRETVKKLTVLL